MIAQDKLGRDFGPGDFIAYGHALGRCAGLRIGKVLDIKQAIPKAYGYTDSNWRITVVGVDDDWGSRPVELCKKGTLMFPSRILKLDPADVPDTIRNLYERAGL